MNSLDAYLPSYEFSTRHEVAVDAPSDVADRALREVTFRTSPSCGRSCSRAGRVPIGQMSRS